MSWNDYLVPKCRENPDNGTIVCETQQVIKGKTIVGDGIFVVDKNSGQVIDDGGLPEPTQKRLIVYLKKTRKIKM